jgi:hypothetical protein
MTMSRMAGLAKHAKRCAAWTLIGVAAMLSLTSIVAGSIALGWMPNKFGSAASATSVSGSGAGDQHRSRLHMRF